MTSSVLSTRPFSQICVSDGARNSAWVSFDGRKRQELLPGDW